MLTLLIAIFNVAIAGHVDGKQATNDQSLVEEKYVLSCNSNLPIYLGRDTKKIVNLSGDDFTTNISSSDSILVGSDALKPLIEIFPMAKFHFTKCPRTCSSPGTIDIEVQDKRTEYFEMTASDRGSSFIGKISCSLVLVL